MDIFQSIILGIVQGLTEFLPISSSGHLVLVPYFLQWDFPPAQAFAFDVLVQVATLAAVIVYFRKDLLSMGGAMLVGLAQRKPFASEPARLGWLILLATLPAGSLGLVFKGWVEKAFASPLGTGFFLLATAALLLGAERLGSKARRLDELGWKDALWIGFFQALAVFPGVSRSGATITGGMLRNLERPAAARFSFLLSIPIMLAAGALSLADLLRTPGAAQQAPVFIPGLIASAITGYLSIHWLLRFLLRRPLLIFSLYCLCLALITFLVYGLR